MLVSVIIPTFNESPEALLRSINSVLNQTYKNIELIIVDDGSKEPFAALQHGITDSRITWLPLPSNSGVAHARNEGIKIPKGKYIAFLDAGDWWRSDKLEKQVALLQDLPPNYGLVYCGAASVFPDGQRIINMPLARGKVARDILLLEGWITGSSSAALFKRECLESVGRFFEGYELPEDWDLWVRVAQKYAIDFVSEVLVNIYITPQSRSSKLKIKEGSYWHMYSKHFELIHNLGIERNFKMNYHYMIARKYHEHAIWHKAIIHATKGLIVLPCLKSAKMFLFCLTGPIGHILLKKIVRPFRNYKLKSFLISDC